MKSGPLGAIIFAVPTGLFLWYLLYKMAMQVFIILGSLV